VDFDDAGMVELAGELHLALEALGGPGLAGEFGEQGLERELPVELFVVNEVDDAHAALAEAFEHLVALADGVAGLKTLERRLDGSVVPGSIRAIPRRWRGFVGHAGPCPPAAMLGVEAAGGRPRIGAS